MSKIIETQYQGRYTSTTQAPLNEHPIKVNAVKFTPVDLLASAYGSCLLGTIDYEAHKENFEVPNAKSEITYEMSENGAGIGSMKIMISFADDFSDAQKEVIQTAAESKCHVGKSLDPNIKKQFEYFYKK